MLFVNCLVSLQSKDKGLKSSVWYKQDLALAQNV